MNQLTNYFAFRNEIIKNHIIYSFIIISFFTLIGESRQVLGFILGSIISLFSFFLLSIKNLQILSKENSANYPKFIIKWYFLRLILYAFALIIGIKYPIIGFSGVVIGIFSIQLTIFFMKIFNLMEKS